jgi:beta-glucosidase
LFEPEPHELQAAQLIFPGYRFGPDEWEAAERLVDLGVGGFCLFQASGTEVARFTEAMQKRAKTPLLFCADYERGAGALVEGGTKLPANMAFGAADSEELVFLKGRITAREARAIGVDWVLAPVVDLAGRADNPIVNVRAFGDEPALVTRLARAFLKGLHDGGAVGCLKHFPGHGDTDVDSHIELPVLQRTLDQLRERELVPYRELASDADSIMTGHLMFPSLDAERPASLSPAAGRLARGLGFGGAIVTDALMMGAIARLGTPRELAALALRAGADILLVPEDPFELHSGLVAAIEDGGVEKSILSAACERVQALKERVPGAVRREGAGKLGLPENRALAGRVASQALCWAGSAGAKLRRGEEAAFLVIGAGGESAASPLLGRLRRLGLKLRPYDGAWRGATIIAVFRYPNAYAGAIGLAPEDVSAICRAAESGPISVVAFGSPYVARQLSAPTLLAFSDEPVLQEAAAGVLAGKEAALGKPPIAL